MEQEIITQTTPENDSLEQVFDNIRAWADAKGLNHGHKQFQKHMAELGEIGDALCKDRDDLFVDGVGDHGVTTINTANAFGHRAEEGVFAVAQEFGITGTLEEVFAELAEKMNEESPFSTTTLFEQQCVHAGRLANAISTAHVSKIPSCFTMALLNLNLLAYSKGHTLDECLRVAWNEIKDRTGKVVNGAFVKSSDLQE